MRRELILLRHAKSSWKQPELEDYDRPLNKRGKRDIPKIARCLEKNHLMPDRILSSPAKRAAQTIKRICDHWAINRSYIHWDERIYAADRDDLLDLLADIPADERRVLLVGHNPGLEELLRYLSRESHCRHSVKLLPTAAVAQLSFEAEWDRLHKGCGDLQELIRPRELDM